VAASFQLAVFRFFQLSASWKLAATWLLGQTLRTCPGLPEQAHAHSTSREIIMAHDTFQVGDLTAVIGDNEAHDQHAAGYNGVHQLIHRSEPATLFVPTVAGLNLEHIFDGDKELRGIKNRNVFFEPRNAAMTFRRLSACEAELHQPPTPTFQLESWTRFKLVSPHYIDFTFRCRPAQHVFCHGYIGIFWASYINAPEDKSMYFRGENGWLQLCTPEHNNQSTVVHKDNKISLAFSPVPGDTLYKNLSPFKYAEPFFYGLFRKHLFLLMFDRSDGIRFTHSPSGGGYNAELQTTNPAWDFQFIIPSYDVGKEYGFRARAVYRERCARQEVVQECVTWRKSLASAP
jgi:hypothetical protein